MVPCSAWAILPARQSSANLNTAQHHVNVPKTSKRIEIPVEEIDFTAVRSPGAGGQNVNKVATAIHLRFDIRASSLPEWIKQRLLDLADKRITAEGVVVIKSKKHRTQERNREAAIERLQSLVDEACHTPKARIKTKPSKAQKKKRLENKRKRSDLKKLRTKVGSE